MNEIAPLTASAIGSPEQPEDRGRNARDYVLAVGASLVAALGTINVVADPPLSAAASRPNHHRRHHPKHHQQAPQKPAFTCDPGYTYHPDTGDCLASNGLVIEADCAVGSHLRPHYIDQCVSDTAPQPQPPTA